MVGALVHRGREGAEASRIRRGRRVVVLLLTIFLLSLGDLVVTIEHLRTIGMIEANPLAAFVIRTTGSWWALALFKGASVGLCVTLLYRTRRYLCSEIAAWCAVAILAALSIVWHAYAEALESPAQIELVQAEADESWLRLD